MKTKRKRTLKMIGVILACMFVCVFCVVLIGVASDGFDNWRNPKEWSMTEVNPNNLLGVANYTLEDGEYNETDIDIEITDDGEIILSGKTTEAVSLIEVQSIALPAGTYYLDPHNDNDDITVYLSNDNGTTKLDEKIKISTSGTYTLFIDIAADADLDDEKLSIVLVEGDESEDFYVMK